MTAKVKNNTTSPLGIGSTIIPPGQERLVPEWNEVRETFMVKKLRDGDFITVSGETEQPANSGLPALPGTNPATPAATGEDAEKDAIIAELQKHGVEKTRRTSLENLKAELAKLTTPAATGGLPGTSQ